MTAFKPMFHIQEIGDQFAKTAPISLRIVGAKTVCSQIWTAVYGLSSSATFVESMIVRVSVTREDVELIKSAFGNTVLVWYSGAEELTSGAGMGEDQITYQMMSQAPEKYVGVISALETISYEQMEIEVTVLYPARPVTQPSL